MSPDGKRVVFSARGEVFTVPAEEGVTRNLTESPGAHDREAAWSPDGKYIAYLSDKDGEYEIYLQAQDGSSDPVQLTSNADTYKFTIRWSPDSKKILWNDKKLRLQYVNIETKDVKLVDQSKVWEFNDFCWSPDSRWIAYVTQLPNNFGKILLFDTETGGKYAVTDDWYSSSDPAFSLDGKYLLFASGRDFNPIYSQTEWNYAYQNMDRIYMAILASGTPNPFTPENNEVEIKKDEPAKAESKKKEGTGDKDKPAEVIITKIDTLGLSDRIVSMSIRPSNYFNITALDGKVYYNEMMAGGDGVTLKFYDLKKKEETELGKGMMFSISADGKKMLVAQDNKYAVIDLPNAKIILTKFVDVSDMKTWVNKSMEWKQIFDEAWRQMRDFFYVPNMHGVDWPAMKVKYGQMLPYVNNRNDLNYLIGEMIAELNIGHAYVLGGDKPAPERIKTGLLGAKISKDASGFFKIDKILKGQNWSQSLRSPLTEIGVDMKEGDFILSVDGKPTDKMLDLYEALLGKADKQVQLTVNSTASTIGSRKVIVIPLSEEAESLLL